jgi:hypothetical protein
LTAKLTIRVAGPADRLLLAGMTALQPIVDELADGVLLIGGLATTAWAQSGPADLPVRATRDVDLGINRRALGLTSTSRRIQTLLERHGFHRRPDDENFRYRRQTESGEFLLDLLLPKDASRDDPPIIEAGIDSVAAPGLAYAIRRGAARLDLTLVTDEDSHRFTLPIATLDAMLVMKAGLLADGTRAQTDRRITDTFDAVVLAAACTHDHEALRALAHAKGREAARAMRWLRSSFPAADALAPRRVERHVASEHGQPGGGDWATATVATFLAALGAAGTSA